MWSYWIRTWRSLIFLELFGRILLHSQKKSHPDHPDSVRSNSPGELGWRSQPQECSMQYRYNLRDADTGAAGQSGTAAATYAQRTGIQAQLQSWMHKHQSIEMQRYMKEHDLFNDFASRNQTSMKEYIKPSWLSFFNPSVVVWSTLRGRFHHVKSAPVLLGESPISLKLHVFADCLNQENRPKMKRNGEHLETMSYRKTPPEVFKPRIEWPWEHWKDSLILSDTSDILGIRDQSEIKFWSGFSHIPHLLP